MTTIFASTILAAAALFSFGKKADVPDMKLLAKTDESYTSTNGQRSVEIGCRAVWVNADNYVIAAVIGGKRTTFLYVPTIKGLAVLSEDSVASCDQPNLPKNGEGGHRIPASPQLRSLFDLVQTDPQKLLASINDGPPYFQMSENDKHAQHWAAEAEKSRKAEAEYAQARAARETRESLNPKQICAGGRYCYAQVGELVETTNPGLECDPAKPINQFTPDSRGIRSAGPWFLCAFKGKSN